jgi:MFS family permease
MSCRCRGCLGGRHVSRIRTKRKQAAAAWMRIEASTSDPLVDVHTLREPAVLRANLASVGLGWALFSSYLLVPEFALAHPGHSGYGLGIRTAAAGLVMLPLAIGQTVAGPAGGAVAGRVAPRAVFAAGLVMIAGALGWLSAVHTGVAQIAAALLLLGVGAGSALQASSAVATQGVSDDVAAASSSLNSTIRRFAGGIGGQVAIILLASASPQSAAAAHFGAFTVAYLIAATLCVDGAAIVLLGGGS